MFCEPTPNDYAIWVRSVPLQDRRGRALKALSGEHYRHVFICRRDSSHDCSYSSQNSDPDQDL
jgi:hypothetical protein